MRPHSLQNLEYLLFTSLLIKWLSPFSVCPYFSVFHKYFSASPEMKVSLFESPNNPLTAELLRQISVVLIKFPWTPIAQKSDAEISFPRVASMSLPTHSCPCFQLLGRCQESEYSIHAPKLFCLRTPVPT